MLKSVGYFWHNEIFIDAKLDNFSTGSINADKPSNNLEVRNIKSYIKHPAPKPHQGTPGKLLMLVVSLSAVAYGLYHLNRWFNATKAKLTRNGGQVPVVDVDLTNVVDDSCKTELYCADGKSGLLDIEYKPKTNIEEYELISMETGKAKSFDNEVSFSSHMSHDTTYDSDLHGFDNQNDYALPRPGGYRIGALRFDFDSNRESLL